MIPLYSTTQSSSLAAFFPHLELQLHHGLSPSAHPELPVEVAFLSEADRDGALELLLLLALHFAGPASPGQLWQVFERGVFCSFGVDCHAIVVIFLDFLDLLVADGLGVERHLSQFFCLAAGSLPVDDADGGFAGS